MILVAMILMAVQDVLTTFLVVAESRGRALLAASLDAAKDAPTFLLAGISGVTLSKKGWGSDTAIVCAISVTSFVTTGIATYLSRRIKADT